MAEISHLQHQTLERLLETLREVPDLSIDLDRVRDNTSTSDHFHDARIDVQVKERPITLLVEVKKAIYPRDVRQVLWQLKRYARTANVDSDRDTQFMFAAESISPGAKELLRTERVGYFDVGGSLFLPARDAYLYIDKPPPRSAEKSIHALFSGRRAQVLHALLQRPQSWFGVTEIAKEAKVAPSTASEVLSQLDRFEWLESRGQGPGKERQLRHPGAILDAWVKQQAALRPPPMRRYYVPEFKGNSLVAQLGRIFNNCQAPYALTSEAAAQRYAPFLSTFSVVRTRLLAGLAADSALAEVGARVVNEGANLMVLETKSAGELLFREQLDGVWLASPVQVYLDLLRGEARAKELAEHLRRERIKF